jgi:hypothetical protein
VKKEGKLLVKERINKAGSMLVTEVLSYRVYSFDNGILMQHLQQKLQSRFGKQGGFLSFFMRREKKGRCFFAYGSKNGTYEDFTPHKEIYYIVKYTDS